MPTTRQINIFLDRLLKEFGDKEFVLASNGGDFPWVQAFAYVSEGLIDGVPVDHPDSERHRFFLVVRNLGFRTWQIDFTCASHREKLSFVESGSNLQCRIIAPPRAGEPVPVESVIEISVSQARTYSEIVDVANVAVEAENPLRPQRERDTIPGASKPLTFRFDT